MAKEGSKFGKEIESLKRRIQASRKHLKQTELKAEDLSALIDATRRTREGAGSEPNLSNKGHGKQYPESEKCNFPRSQ